MVKNSPANAGDEGSIPWVRKIPWKKKWQPTPVSLPGKSPGQRSLAGYSAWGHQRAGHDWVTKKHQQQRVRLWVKDLISFTWITLLVPWTVCQVGTVIVPALQVRYLRVSRRLNNLPKVTDWGWFRGGSAVLSWAAAAKSLQSCPTLCDPTDGSPPGSPVPGILQARTLEWVAISFSNA